MQDSSSVLPGQLVAHAPPPLAGAMRKMAHERLISAVDEILALHIIRVAPETASDGPAIERLVPALVAVLLGIELADAAVAEGDEFLQFRLVGEPPAGDAPHRAPPILPTPHLAPHRLTRRQSRHRHQHERMAHYLTS